MTAAPDYLEPYREAVERAGPTWEAQLWHSPEAQRARFGAILRVADLAGRPVADLGCGRGDLAGHLAAEGVEHAGYVGVDALEPMVREAERRAAGLGWARCSFEVGDFVADPGVAGRLAEQGRAGVVVVSGSLNTLGQGEAQRVLAGVWEGLSPGAVLAFNFLCERRGDPPTPGDPAVRFSAPAMLDWALSRSRAVRFARDYLGTHDATIALRAGA